MNVALLNQIKEASLDEPLRINMTEWVLNAVEKDSWNQHPPCETVACIAGWAVAISRGLIGKLSIADYHAISGSYIADDAQRLLNLDDRSASRLFFVAEWPLALQRAIVGLRPGSPGYAAIVAERIDLFISSDGTE